MKRVLRFFGIWILGFGICSLARAQNATYILATGAPTFAVQQPVPMGFINLANGDLHLEIPVASYPQRGGGTYVAKFVYDSRIWQVVDDGEDEYWEPTNGPGSPETGGGDTGTLPWGWRFQTTGQQSTNGMSNAGFYSATLNECTYDSDAYYWYSLADYGYSDISGTLHQFPVAWQESVPCNTATSTLSNSALDATGYLMNLSSTYGVATQVIAPDGTTVWGDGTTNKIWEDPNGNYMSWDGSGNVVDTLGRDVVQESDGSTSNTYSVLNSALYSPATWTVYFDTSESYSTDFGIDGIYEASGTYHPVREILLPDGTTYQFTYDSYGLMASMTMPNGQTIDFTHSNYTDSLSNTNRWATSATYGGGTWDYTPANCAGYCNYNVVTKPSGDQTFYAFALNNAGAWNQVTEAYTGSDSGGTLLETITTAYNTSITNPLGGIGFVTPTSVTATVPGASGSIVTETATTTDTFSYSYQGTSGYTGSRGNVTDVKQYAYGSGSHGGLLKETTNTYLTGSSYLTANIVNRVTDSQTLNSSATKIAETIASYDSNSLTGITGVVNHDDTNYGTGNTVRGNPTVTEAWTGSGSSTSCSSLNYLCTTNTYDTTGQPLSTTDAAGNSTTMSYANNFYETPGGSYNPGVTANAYVTSTTLPVSGTVTAGYYWGSGLKDRGTDQNGNTSTWSYDQFGRTTNVTGPAGSSTSASYSSATEVDLSNLASGSSYEESSAVVNPGSSTITYSLTSDPSGTDYIVKTYDGTGRLYSQTNPCRTCEEPTSGYTYYTYDGLNRTIQKKLPSGDYRYWYYGAAVGTNGGRTSQICSSGTYGIGAPLLSVDEAGKKRQEWTDALGRVIEADEPDSSGSLTSGSALGTCYQYDVLGDLTQVVQGSQTRTFVYDGLSRLTSETTPEGGTAYTYYTTSGGALCAGSAKAVCRTTDARSVTITYTYDGENRMTDKSYSSSDPSVSYSYDQSSCSSPLTISITNGKGQRTCMTDGSGSTAWSYDAEGRVLTMQRAIGSVVEAITYAYNADGTVSEITYPSGLQVGETYDLAGRPTWLCQESGCTTFFASGGSYAPQGALSSLILEDGSYESSDGITVTNTYNNRLQPVNMQAVRGSDSTTLLSLTYSFVASSVNDGHVKTITNNLDTGRTQNFTYDSLDRLATAQSGATSGADCWGQSYSYDQYGNLTGASVTQCSAPSLSLSINSSTNQITNTGFSYDAAGNVTADNVNSYTWNGAGRMASAASVDYTYDGDGNRVEKSGGPLYWFGPDGKLLAESDTSGNITSEYIYFGSARIARRDPSSGNIYYFLGDQLGSSRVITDSSGNIQNESDFYPFGTERVITSNITEDHKFAGMQRDSETGLDHTNDRQYESSLGHWLSPDPTMGQASQNPLLWNGYSYVFEAPLDATDPDGSAPACLDEYSSAGGCFGWFDTAEAEDLSLSAKVYGSCNGSPISSGGSVPIISGSPSVGSGSSTVTIGSTVISFGPPLSVDGITLELGPTPPLRPGTALNSGNLAGGPSLGLPSISPAFFQCAQSCAYAASIASVICYIFSGPGLPACLAGVGLGFQLCLLKCALQYPPLETSAGGTQTAARSSAGSVVASAARNLALATDAGWDEAVGSGNSKIRIPGPGAITLNP